MKLSLLFMLFAFLAAALGFEPADKGQPSIVAVRIDGNLDLTGTLSDPRWNLGQPVEINSEYIPKEATPARQRTTVKMLYSSDHVYFGFDCIDAHPEEIRAHLTDRDKFFTDDFVNVVLDTYGDNQHAYEFVLNPYGIQGDLLETGPTDDASFDAVWESAASINGHGWTAELAIPLKSLRFPAD